MKFLSITHGPLRNSRTRLRVNKNEVPGTETRFVEKTSPSKKPVRHFPLVVEEEDISVSLIQIQGSATRALIGATVGFFVGFAAVSLFGPTAILLQEAMGLSPLQVGFLVAVPSATGSLLRIPFGAWVDTTGGCKPFMILLILSALGMAGLLLLLGAFYPDRLTSAHFPLIIILGMLVGCGIATFSVGIGQITYWYPQARQGQVLALYAGLGNLAPGIFAFLVPVLIGMTTLSWTYAVWLVILVTGIAAYATLSCNAPFFQFWHEGHGNSRNKSARRAAIYGEKLFPSGGVREGLLATVRLPRTWALIFLYFTSFGGFLALTAWLPFFWSDRFDQSLTNAGTLTMVYAVLTSIIRVPGGFMSDRWGGEKVATGSFAVMLAGALVLMVSTSLTMAVMGCVLMAVGMGTANAAVFKLVPRFLASAGGGAGAGWVGGLGAFGGFALPPILGALVGHYGLELGCFLGFAIFAALAVASLMVLTLLMWKREQVTEEEQERAGLVHYQVTCPEQGCPAEVWVQASSGEIPPIRLVSCSLLPEGTTCQHSCLTR